MWIKLERVIEKSRQDPLLLVCLAHMARYCCKYKSPEVWEVCQHLKLSEKGMQLAQKTGEKKYFVIFLMTAAKSRYLQEDLE